MEDLLSFACQHAEDAYWLVFVLLLLAGLNIPISEDVVMLTAGAFASTCLDGNTYVFYLYCYLAALLSGWEVYWIGRLLGPKLYNVPFLNHMVNKDQIDKLHYYYDKYGILVFLVGRFIPGGFRNALFITAGMGKMPFPIFMLRDGISCIFSTGTLFTIGYQFAEHYDAIVATLRHYSFFGFGLFVALIAGFIIWRKWK